MTTELLLFAALLVISGFFSSAETALMALNRVRLTQRAEQGDVGARRLTRLLADPKRLLGTILVGNNLANVACASLATMIVIATMSEAASGESGVASESTLVVIATLATTILLLIFGEMTPKGLAVQYPERVARMAAIPLQVLNVVFFPVVWTLMSVSRTIDRALPSDGAQAPVVSRGDVLATVEVGSAEGALSLAEADMLRRVLLFRERRVKDIMTPRTDMISVSLTDSLETVHEVFRTDRFARLPVTDESRDAVVGVVHVRDLATRAPGSTESLADLMRAPKFVPELQPLSRLLGTMQGEQQHLFIAVDEYGGTAGVVTLEDVLEELVGEILDEFDVEPETIRSVGSNAWVCNGATPLPDVVVATGSSFAEDGVQTLAGFVLARLGRIPNEGDIVHDGEFTITVRAVKDQRVRRVAITRRHRPSEPRTPTPRDAPDTPRPNPDSTAEPTSR